MESQKALEAEQRALKKKNKHSRRDSTYDVGSDASARSARKLKKRSKTKIVKKATKANLVVYGGEVS